MRRLIAHVLISHDDERGTFDLQMQIGDRTERRSAKEPASEPLREA